MENRKIGIIIQARTKSARLPNKVILPIYKEMTVLEVMIHRLRALELPICIATTCKREDDEIIEIAKEWRCRWFRFQDEEDVLGRIINAGKYLGWEKIIRVCADSVFIDVEFIKSMLYWSDKIDAGYITYKSRVSGNGMDVFKMIGYTKTGFFAELIDLEVLKSSDKKLKILEEAGWFNKEYLKRLRENVTEFTYTFDECEEFYLYAPINMEKIKLTIDTQEEFDLCKEIINKLGYDCTWKEIVLYLRKRK